MRPQRPPATVESIKEGCARLAIQLGSLKHETAGLSERLKRYKRGREIPPDRVKVEIAYGWDLDRHRGERVFTPDPLSPIEELEKELQGQQLEVANQILLAIGLEIDGAVREVRAARATLQAIADNSDLRADFKDWQSRNS